MLRNLVLASMLFTGCFQAPSDLNQPSDQFSQSAPSATTTRSCDLPAGKYAIQDAVYNKTKKTYQVMLLGAPSCAEQPAVLSNVALGRIEEGEKEDAVLMVSSANGFQILMAKNYQMKMVETQMQNGVEVTSEPSLWSPLLSGAAGAIVGSVVGGAIANKMMDRKNKPQQPIEQKSYNTGANASKAVGNGSTTRPMRPSYNNGLRSKRRASGFMKRRRR